MSSHHICLHLGNFKMFSSPINTLPVFREKKAFITLCIKKSDSGNIQFNSVLLFLLIKCDSGKEPVFGTHRMVPLSKGSALHPREYDESVQMVVSLGLLV